MNFLPVVFYSLIYAALNVSGAALVKSELQTYKLASLRDYFFLVVSVESNGRICYHSHLCASLV